MEKNNKASKQRGKNGKKRKNEWEIIEPNDFVDKQLKNLKHLSYGMENEINKTNSPNHPTKLKKKNRKNEKKKKVKLLNRTVFPLKENDTLSSYSSTTKSNDISAKITKSQIIETTEIPVSTTKVGFTTKMLRPKNSTWFELAEKVIAENVSSIPIYTVKPGSSIDKYFEKYLAKNQNLTRKWITLRKKTEEDSKELNKFVKNKSDNQTIEIVMLKNLSNENHPVSYETVSEDSKEINCESKDCEYLKKKFDKLLREFELLNKRFNRCRKSIDSGLVESQEDAKDEKETRSEFGVEVFADAEKFQSEETKGLERTTSSAVDVEVFDVKNEIKKSESIGPGVTTPKTRPPKSRRNFNKTRNNQDRPKKSWKTTLPIVRTDETSEPSTTPSTNSNSAETTTIEPVDYNFIKKATMNVLCIFSNEFCEDQEKLPISSNHNFEIPKEDKLHNFDDKFFKGNLETFPDEDKSENHKLENVNLSRRKEDDEFETDNEIIEVDHTPKRCRPELDFDCKNGNCIPDEKMCDGTIDCSDGSDENISICKGRLQVRCLLTFSVKLQFTVRFNCPKCVRRISHEMS